VTAICVLQTGRRAARRSCGAVGRRATGGLSCAAAPITIDLPRRIWVCRSGARDRGQPYDGRVPGTHLRRPYRQRSPEGAQARLGPVGRGRTGSSSYSRGAGTPACRFRTGGGADLNARATDESLRSEDCRITCSMSRRATDADRCLGAFLVTKRGPLAADPRLAPRDHALAEGYRTSADKSAPMSSRSGEFETGAERG
jgi:hypothetical protein